MNKTITHALIICLLCNLFPTALVASTNSSQSSNSSSSYFNKWTIGAVLATTAAVAGGIWWWKSSSSRQQSRRNSRGHTPPVSPKKHFSAPQPHDEPSEDEAVLQRTTSHNQRPLALPAPTSEDMQLTVAPSPGAPTSSQLIPLMTPRPVARNILSTLQTDNAIRIPSVDAMVYRSHSSTARSNNFLDLVWRKEHNDFLDLVSRKEHAAVAHHEACMSSGVNSTDPATGLTGLMIAAQQSDKQMIKLLLADSDAREAIDFSLRGARSIPANAALSDKQGNLALHHAVRTGSKPVVTELLKAETWRMKRDQMINKQNDVGLTSLHVAVQANKAHIVDLLLQQKADVNINDNDSQTPLWYAMQTAQHHPHLLAPFYKNQGTIDWSKQVYNESAFRALYEQTQQQAGAAPRAQQKPQTSAPQLTHQPGPRVEEAE